MILQNRQKILIVDDVIENIKILVNLLKSDYETFFAKNGEKALELAEVESPDLILLDIVMPDIDGYEVCRQLKSNKITADIPVIFVTAMNETGNETKGLELGAADYITKPINPAIVKARIANQLRLRQAIQELKRLYNTALDANPLTSLPGNNSVANRIEKALANNEKISIIYADLDNFKAYNDKYGFALGDEVILFTAQVLKDAVHKNGTPEDFIGHIGGDDFVVVVSTSRVKEVATRIGELFDKGITVFYNADDIATKCIQSVDRQGKKQTFPIISISMAGVDLSNCAFSQYIEVNDACAETKKMAKKMPGSGFFMNRRSISKKK